MYLFQMVHIYLHKKLNKLLQYNNYEQYSEVTIF
jgi:hypothetical protein